MWELPILVKELFCQVPSSKSVLDSMAVPLSWSIPFFPIHLSLSSCCNLYFKWKFENLEMSSTKFELIVRIPFLYLISIFIYFQDFGGNDLSWWKWWFLLLLLFFLHFFFLFLGFGWSHHYITLFFFFLNSYLPTNAWLIIYLALVVFIGKPTIN